MIKNLLAKKGLTLIVSLPNNSIEMAEAALAGGADAIKIHANVAHRASGNHFPSLKEQKDIVSSIIKLAGNTPVGLVPGDAPEKITAEELQLAEELGIDFLSIYAHHAPIKELENCSLDKVIAFNSSYNINSQFALSNLNIDVIEGSIVNKNNYGDRLTYRDIINYSILKKSVNMPVIISTQKAIQVEELSLLSKTGIDSVMIGAIVTGKTPEGVKETTKKFKTFIEERGC